MKWHVLFNFFFLMLNILFQKIHVTTGRSGGSGNFMGRGGNYGGGSGGGGGGNFGRGKCVYLVNHLILLSVLFFLIANLVLI